MNNNDDDDFAAFGIRKIDWALVEAARNRRWPKVQRIITRHGGNATIGDYTWDSDRTILEMAIIAGEMEMVQWLVEVAHVNVNHSVSTRGNQGRTALHTAVKTTTGDQDYPQKEGCNNDNVKIVKYLLAKGADLRLKTSAWGAWGDTPLHVACYQSNNDAVIGYLLAHMLAAPVPNNCNAMLINDKNKAGKTPLSFAVERNSSHTLMNMIVRNGADVLAEAVDGSTPLHSIIQKGKLAVLQWLIETKRIDRDYTDNRGRCIMHLASSSSWIDNNRLGDAALNVLKWLIANGFSYQVSWRDAAGKTPLHVASTPDIAAVLVQQAGADIHARTTNSGGGGATPLHSALSTPHCSLEIIQWLVVHGGANVNAQDEQGRTPLHVAISIEDSQAAEWLSTCGGADLTIQDDQGRSPLDVALLDCDESMLQCWGYKSPILTMLQQEVLERYLEVQTLAKKGAFSCPVRRPTMIGWCL